MLWGKTARPCPEKGETVEMADKEGQEGSAARATPGTMDAAVRPDLPMVHKDLKELKGRTELPDRLPFSSSSRYWDCIFVGNLPNH